MYTDVWMLSDVPEEYGIPKKDNGVDLVAKDKDGNLTAIQAKFYQHKIGKDQVDSYLAELGKHYYQSGLFVSTVDIWNKSAEDEIQHNIKPIGIIGLSDLRNSQIDWNTFDFKRPEKVKITQKKQLRKYQEEALNKAVEHFSNNDRGQLIMAPGTGKTFTSLKIAEKMARKQDNQFKVLYLVPSIQLLTQTLRGWNNDSETSITSMAVTSDRDASRSNDGTEDIKATDIGYPATTSSDKIIDNYKRIKKQSNKDKMLVVFSTYQSIEVIGESQKKGFPEFDLIIADEAHRTTGAHLADKDDSIFSKVHSNSNVRGKKRMYQTATPKVYGETAKKNAKDKSIIVLSMDDKNKYGEVFYRMGFGTAVNRGILTDYKVMVLAVDESAVQKDMQRTLSDPENGLNIDDVGRIVGIWNGMMRRNGYKNPKKNGLYDGVPLERAIAFTKTIEDSKKISNQFEEVVNDYLSGHQSGENEKLRMRHADGTMNAIQKNDVLDWLANPNKPDNEARIVSNVRFLTEGIDVPSLDAIIFMAPKKSQVDIVQAVGRIMRKAPGKDYGYIILPIVIPADETPESILDNNKRYDTVWQVINALRSVDERFEAMVDKINIAKPKQMKVIGVGEAPDEKNDTENITAAPVEKPVQTELDLQWDKFEGAIYGKIVEKVGNRKYLENWSDDVAKIAQRQIAWIKNKLSDKNDPITIEFNKFVSSLKHNINDSIDENQAAEMLSQHLITKPVFEALFDKSSFVNDNPVSQAMENIVTELEKAGFAKEQENLEPLYESVKMRAEGIEKPEDKQKILVTLYDKFFSTAFKSTTERLGIVFTPVEVVDFIVKSVDDLLNKYFHKSLADNGVHVLDPFTGTGTFIVRTLTYLKHQLDTGEITFAYILRKYMHELHANEIVLLSYYIAAINIETTFAEIDDNKNEYKPFEGIVLTDTFESTENEDTLDDNYFGSNDKRLKKQQETPITVIIGNPPYSAKQNNEDANIKRVSYKKLDDKLRKTYVKSSTATNKNNLFDSYIKAIRWSTDRIDKNGVIGFITNNSFIDGNAMDGMRNHLIKEFSDIYIFNLKGSIRGKIGNDLKAQGGNIFDIMTGVTIVFLIKSTSVNNDFIHYFEIGDELTKKEKLKALSNYSNINNIENKFTLIKPNQKNDWINQRNSNFDRFIELGSKKDKNALFIDYTGGIKTGRDAWSWGFNKNKVEINTKKSIKFYNDNLGNVDVYSKKTNKISWTKSLKNSFEKKDTLLFNDNRMYIGMYRPFTKKYVYNSSDMVDRQYQMKKVLPTSISDNIMISLSNKTQGTSFSSLMINVVPDVNLFKGGSQNLPIKLYDNIGSYPAIRKNLLKKFDDSKDSDIFYYIYGVLNSRDYGNMYKKNLAKEFPRLPILKNRESYIKIGKKLSELHLNYENQSIYNGIKIISKDNPNYRISKMIHPKERVENGKQVKDLTRIKFNEDIEIENIPEKAYEYVVNGKPAIEWIIDQYQVKIDKKSGITDDPNEFSDDPKYIFNLLMSIITVSMETLNLIDQLPKFELDED
ncbi:DEAD/DEAH box helicase family protein [Fructilactobacillus hinvesii]|uniref:DEAD/DEAH box helicase family protein n=1 Tax=Fructilactobacillus hinvesii TaxID=2940300 RepID=A0ABY5BVJ8_9LACO|nr:DEAD/DEAH box helicase family protein [Fructilactobacillus hinvesii]